MGNYSKAISAGATSLAAWLVGAGYIDAGEAETLVTGVLSILTVVGVYSFANKPL